MTVRDIYSFLDRLFPFDTACDFDNSGLLAGDFDADVNNVLITLDCTKKAIDKAIGGNCELIITHHPVIFTPLKAVTADTPLYKAIRNGISIISAHTNLDMAKDGVGECLCKTINLFNIASFSASDGFILKKGDHSPVSAADFAKEISGALGGRVKYTDTHRKIEKVLVCSGSGGEFIADAEACGFDALVTADVKHHQFIAAEKASVCLFDAGHFETEDIIIEPLKATLKTRFPEINFHTYHSDLIKYSE